MYIILFCNFIVLLRKLGLDVHKYKNSDDTFAFDLFPQSCYLMVFTVFCFDSLLGLENLNCGNIQFQPFWLDY